jgi:signal transduction histidine kinase
MLGLKRMGKISQVGLFDRPAEQLIAVGRVIFCLFFLSALVIGSASPSHGTTAEVALLSVYSAFALAVLLLRVWRLPYGWTAYTIHLIDICILVILLLWARDQIGAFFAVFILFLLLAASVRWAWRGAIANAIGLGAIVFLLGVISKGPQDVSASLFNCAYVLISGAMIGYLSALRNRHRDQVLALADWPAPNPSQFSTVTLDNLLTHCALTLEVPRVLVVWEEAEEPVLNIAILQRGQYHQTSEMAGAFGEFLTAPRLSNAAFWTDNAQSTLILTHEGPIRLPAPIIDKALLVNYQIQSVGTAPFKGTLCKGRLFVLDRATWSDFQLSLTEIIAARIGNALDRQIMQQQARDAAALMERDQLAHDVHDGLLQGLAAIGLQLKLVTDGDPNEIGERLDTIKQLVNQEQRRIREFLRQKARRTKLGSQVLLRQELQKVETEANRLWNCKLSLAIDPPDVRVSDEIGFHLPLMLMEAVANAARHGSASLVDISIRKTSDAILVNVQDNGHGFAGAASADEANVKTELRPASLRARISKLSGSLNVSSSADGVELKIRLPVK